MEIELKTAKNVMKPGANAGSEPRIDPISLLSEPELIDLRARVDSYLPVKLLREMSLEEEMVLQYRAVRGLQAAVLADKDIEPNKQAQVVNSCASALDNLVKMQERYHHAERLKQIETHLIEVLNTFPPELTRTFFERYEGLKL